MRRFIPRKTDLATLSHQRFHALLRAYNNTPRKCLDFKTPAEMFHRLLHFECESTSAFAGTNGESNKLRSFPRKRESRAKAWVPAFAGTNGESTARRRQVARVRWSNRANGR